MNFCFAVTGLCCVVEAQMENGEVKEEAEPDGTQARTIY